MVKTKHFLKLIFATHKHILRHMSGIVSNNNNNNNNNNPYF